MSSPAPDRLAYLDGLRGIAALIVMSEHALAGDRLVTLFGPLGLAWWEWLLWPLTSGVQMVYLFIALSGFGLAHGELARRERGEATPFWGFWRRRAWRILPVYYAAIALSLLAWALEEALRQRWGFTQESFVPLTAKGLLAHLLLVHDYCQPWLMQVEPPLWSIAIEWQLYLVFPLALAALLRLPVGVVAGVPVIAVLGFDALGGSYPNLASMFLAHLGLWFVGGIAAAKLARQGLPVRAGLLVGLGALALAVGFGFGLLAFQRVPGVQAIWAVAVFCLLLGLHQAPAARWNVPTWPVFRAVGRWSYSLYAIHHPVLALVFIAVACCPLPSWAHSLVMLGLGGAAACLAARGLYALVERPAIARMAGRPKAARSLDASAGFGE